MRRWCSTFYKRQAKKIAQKRELHQSIVTNYIQTKIYFALFKSALLCLRGLKSLSRNLSFVGDNIEVEQKVAKIQNIVQQNHKTVKNNDNNIFTDAIDYKVMTVALQLTTNKQNEYLKKKNCSQLSQQIT